MSVLGQRIVACIVKNIKIKNSWMQSGRGHGHSHERLQEFLQGAGAKPKLIKVSTL